MTITALHNDRQAAILKLEFASGDTRQLSHATLRAACRCAHCMAQQRGTGHVTAPEDVASVKLEQLTPVGVYGLQLVFSDGHARGIYPWTLLEQLAMHD